MKLTSTFPALLLLVSSFLYGQTPSFPFPQHTTYTSGSIMPSNYTQAELDGHLTDFYDLWKVAYLNGSCGANLYYIEYQANANVSEGLGYGMMITAIMAGYDASAKTYFDGLYNFFKAHPSSINANLMSWKQVNCNNSDGNDSATDGDLDIAYGLLLAHAQWGSSGTINYLVEAQNMINAIMQDDINPVQWSVKLGDWVNAGNASYYNATRPSDFVTDHFRAFECATNDANWTNVINTCYTLIADMQSNFSTGVGFVPDFIINLNTTPSPAGASFLEGQYDGDYYYNACRVPWRLGSDYLLYGETRAKTALDAMNAWLKTNTSNNPNNLSNGYLLNGTKIFNWSDPAFVGAFGVAAMTDVQHQAWLNALYQATKDQTFASVGYYENTLKLLYMTVMSGNYWDPICNLAPAPTASFTLNPSTGVAPLSVSFDASASSDPDGSTLTYNWNFGDGMTGTGQTTSHIFTNIGVFTITLTVTNTGGVSHSTTQTVTVNNPNPINPTITITAPTNNSTITAGNITLTATAADADGSIQTVFFTVDGQQINATNTSGNTWEATWVANVPNTYSITATATDNENLTATNMITVTIEANANPDITMDFSVNWDGGTSYCVDITIYNNSPQAIGTWTINFTCEDDIYDYWNADWTDNNDGTYTAIAGNTGCQVGIPAGGNDPCTGWCANYTGNISIPSNVTLNGMPVQVSVDGVLPINIIDFSSKLQDNHIQLDWLIAPNGDLAYFEVEKSTDGRHFSTLQKIAYTTSTYYLSTDTQPQEGNNFYRLKMVEKNGHYKYSDITATFFSGHGYNFQLLSNLLSEKLSIIAQPIQEELTVTIVNLQGQVVTTKSFAPQILMEIDISQYVSGLYFIVIRNTQGQVMWSNRFVSKHKGR